MAVFSKERVKWILFFGGMLYLYGILHLSTVIEDIISKEVHSSGFDINPHSVRHMPRDSGDQIKPVENPNSSQQHEYKAMKQAENNLNVANQAQSQHNNTVLHNFNGDKNTFLNNGNHKNTTNTTDYFLALADKLDVWDASLLGMYTYLFLIKMTIEGTCGFST